ncbi:hypothetical protein UT300012_24190 [Paraclostridium bifermentans]
MKLGIDKKWYLALLAGGLALALYTVNIGIDYIRIERGTKLLELLYDFGDVKDLEKRRPKVESVATDKVTNQVYDLDRSLSAYLKMQGSYSKIVFLTTTPNYIIYELHSDVLTSSRKFMLMYDVNIFGKVDDIREVEIVDFI